jgi:hypothetical protein
MSTKIKLHAIRSLQCQTHEHAVLMRDDYDPAMLQTKTKINFHIEPDKNLVHVLMKIKYLYSMENDSETELFSHTCDTVFEVFDGFQDTFTLTKKGFRVTEETFNGLLRFFIVTSIGNNRGMIAAKTVGTLIENHPLKLLNLEDFLDFVKRTNPNLEIVQNATEKIKPIAKRKRK